MNLRHIALSLGFVLALFALDRGFGALGAHWLERTTSGTDGPSAVQHALDSAPDAELLVFGTSRAAHHIDAQLIGRALGLTAYNAGVTGYRISYAHALLELLLQRGADPELIVLQAEPFGLYQPYHERMTVLAPWVDEHPVVREVVEHSSDTARFKLLSHAYRFNSQFLVLAQESVAPSSDRPDRFLGLEGTLDHPPHPAAEVEAEQLRTDRTIDPLVVEHYDAFLARAAEAGIPVVMVVGPRYQAGGQGDSAAAAIEIFEALAAEHGATWLPLTEADTPDLMVPELWRDENHLNTEGATRFSTMLAERLAALRS